MEKIKINYDVNGMLLTFAIIETDTNDSEITCLRVTYNIDDFENEHEIYNQLLEDFDCEYDRDECEMLEEIVEQAYIEWREKNERID